jgi:hypothetical protein
MKVNNDNSKDETDELMDVEDSPKGTVSDGKSNFYDALSIILLSSFVLCLFFLFWGEPDVWDALRNKLIN